MAATKRPGDVASVDVYTAKGLLSVGHRYLDVRTVEEFNKSHVENALNIPYMFITEEGRVKNPEFLTQISSILKKQDHLVVGCNSGGRSLKACVDLLNEVSFSGFPACDEHGGGLLCMGGQ
ncbi:rhodanese-like domain-containing protein 19, mitochondrial isoform X2 [Prunus persica]|uniref:rhodanese-like domain-containing protein 19, mitochondrial isoform X2 n=1 Tax=Prunus persica TaxID=3760 RepID=UPI0009AB5A82|nr:rhodanese-like domain-containing protein 19, mitochondrial isoform X2 [Prunus persica]